MRYPLAALAFAISMTFAGSASAQNSTYGPGYAYGPSPEYQSELAYAGPPAGRYPSYAYARHTDLCWRHGKRVHCHGDW